MLAKQNTFGGLRRRVIPFTGPFRLKSCLALARRLLWSYCQPMILR